MPDVTPVPKTKKRRPAKPSTNKEVATRLHSKIVRHVGVCALAPGRTMQGGPCAGQLQAAHIIRRRYAATRTDLENAICLCSRHHAYLDSHLYDLICVTDLVYGIGHYHRLQKKADAGIAATGLSPLMFWRGERERLTEIAKRLRII